MVPGIRQAGGCSISRQGQTKLVFWLWSVAMLLCASACEFHVGPLQQGDSSGGAKAEGEQGPSGEVWVYTSIYQSVIEQLDPVFQKKYPNLKVQWYRAGSEKVATRLDTELRAGGTQADLVVTSDPFWYLKLKKEGRLSPHVSVDMLPLSRDFLDTEGFYATCRVSTMVIAYHPELMPESEVPRSFRALTEERYKDKVTLGDPLSSGTHFTTTAFLSNRYGWSFYETLRAQGALASGGNSSVLRRVEGKEFPIGVVLLENVLANQAKGSPVKYVVPSDGAITIPGYAAILSSTDNEAGARAVYNVLMSSEGQKAMVLGNMHSANPSVKAPKGAPGFEEVARGGFRWTPEFIEKIQTSAADVKSRFDATMNQ